MEQPMEVSNTNRNYDNILSESLASENFLLSSTPPIETNQSTYQLVYIDLETSGFGQTEILQIAMKQDDKTFDMYVTPTRPIHHKATEVNGLTTEAGELYKHGVKVDSFPLEFVMVCMLKFLKEIGNNCVLVAHNGHTYDSQHLVKTIRSMNFVEEFKFFVAGFVDTLKLFREKFPERKGKGECTLATLFYETFPLSETKFHDAVADTECLEMLAIHHFSKNHILNRIETVDEVILSQIRKEHIKKLVLSLEPLNISNNMKSKLADNNISMQLLIDTYKKGENEVLELLQQKVNGKKIITRKSILNDILQFLQYYFLTNPEEC